MPTKFISLDTSFFKIFFTIKELPYITVLDEDHHFYGILTHSTLLNMLSQSWNIQTGSYVITVVSTGKRGDTGSHVKDDLKIYNDRKLYHVRCW